MDKLGLMKVLLGLSFGVIAVSGGCAKGSHQNGVGGYGEGASGEGASTSEGATGGGGSASTGGTGGDTSPTGSTSSSSSSSSSSGMCGANQHECSGQCFGNTPESGCLQAAAGCPPCAPPQNGSGACTAAGVCDFFCNTGYHKQGSVCVCDSACCSNQDCQSGQTCQGGTCTSGGGGAGGSGGGCDDTTCQLECVAECFIQGSFGLGTCNGDTCDCQCL